MFTVLVLIDEIFLLFAIGHRTLELVEVYAGSFGTTIGEVYTMPEFLHVMLSFFESFKLSVNNSNFC